MDTTLPVARLDYFCDLAVGVARHAAALGWPDQLVYAAWRLARELELLAGALDTAQDPPAARAWLAEARATLPRAFETFARAVADDLSTRPQRIRYDPAVAP